VNPTPEAWDSTVLNPAAEARAHWRAARLYLNENRYELARNAATLYPKRFHVGSTPLLAREEWIPGSPVPLESVELNWSSDEVPPLIDGSEPESEHVRPLRMEGERYSSYADALQELDPPRMLENRRSYRLLSVGQSNKDGIQLTFCRGRYFSIVNFSEAIAHELADAVLLHRAPSMDPTKASLPFRSLVTDPCDPLRRPVLPAISTLTLRRSAANGASFILHWRDPARVVHGGGLYQVMPVGMFQPSGDASWNEINDFNLWRCMAREFSEELLGTSEDYGSEEAPIDYDGWPFFRAMDDARRSGRLRVYWLGIGVDPLSLATDMLTVAVFDDEIFDSLFSKLVSRNDEGRIVGAGQDATVPFTEETVERFVRAQPMQPAGAALLELAWRHRSALLGG
jgi:hypothetical protein